MTNATPPDSACKDMRHCPHFYDGEPCCLCAEALPKSQQIAFGLTEGFERLAEPGEVCVPRPPALRSV